MRIIKFLASIKVAVILLALIIVASVIGTLLPEGGRVYKSWWFILILGCFGVNLLVCSFTGIKWQKQRLGLFITHLGVLVILMGVMISAFLSERGYISLYEGTSSDLLVADSFQKQLEFKVFLEDFTTEWKEAHSLVSGFKSRIRIIKQDKEMLTQEISVNHPLRYGGFTLLQSSYDPLRPNWTVIEAVNDPGVKFVFSGFILLNLGVLMAFYRKLKLPQKGQENGIY